jgi:hypothetical protein
MAGPDGGGILAARVVVGDEHDVGQFGGNRAHLRPLAAVAVAAAAEHHHKPARRVWPQRFQRMLQGIGRVGIVDEHRRSGAAGGDKLKPALGPLRYSRARSATDSCPPAATTRPAATRALDAWKSPTSGRQISYRALPASTTNCCARPLRWRSTSLIAVRCAHGQHDQAALAGQIGDPHPFAVSVFTTAAAPGSNRSVNSRALASK